MSLAALITSYIIGGIIGGLIGHYLARYILTTLDRRREARRLAEAEQRRIERDEIREGVLALRGEYEDKVTDVVITATAEYAESVESARRILDEEVVFHKKLEDLFGPGGSYRKDIYNRWGMEA